MDFNNRKRNDNKMTFEEYKKEVDKNINNLFSKANEEERKLLNNMIKTINEMCEKEQNLITFFKIWHKNDNRL